MDWIFFTKYPIIVFVEMKVIYQPSHCSGVLYQDDRHVENGGVVNTESFDVVNRKKDTTAETTGINSNMIAIIFLFMSKPLSTVSCTPYAGQTIPWHRNKQE